MALLVQVSFLPSVNNDRSDTLFGGRGKNWANPQPPRKTNLFKIITTWTRVPLIVWLVSQTQLTFLLRWVCFRLPYPFSFSLRELRFGKRKLVFCKRFCSRFSFSPFFHVNANIFSFFFFCFTMLKESW